MNYKRIYSEIILNRVNNPLPEDVYGQKHHVLPKSLYPQYKNTKANLVKLTAREHYICHHLLWKYYASIGDKNSMYKMVLAWQRMCKNTQGLTVSNKMFQQARLARHTTPMSEQTRKKLSVIKKGKKLGPFTQQHKNNMSKSLIGNKNVNGKIWINDGCKEYMVYPDRIPEGFKIGRLYKNNNRIYKKWSQQQKKKLSQSFKNRRWINNGIENRIISLDADIPTGYVLGRLKKK